MDPPVAEFLDRLPQGIGKSVFGPVINGFFEAVLLFSVETVELFSRPHRVFSSCAENS